MSDQENKVLKSETAKREEEIVAFWKENNIFEKSLKKTAPKGEYIFYDGPPFATGLPHYGSLLARGAGIPMASRSRTWSRRSSTSKPRKIF
jgi:isoleucyl-tRNA synthetase